MIFIVALLFSLMSVNLYPSGKAIPLFGFDSFVLFNSVSYVNDRRVSFERLLELNDPEITSRVEAINQISDGWLSAVSNAQSREGHLKKLNLQEEDLNNYLFNRVDFRESEIFLDYVQHGSKSALLSFPGFELVQSFLEVAARLYIKDIGTSFGVQDLEQLYSEYCKLKRIITEKVRPKTIEYDSVQSLSAAIFKVLEQRVHDYQTYEKVLAGLEGSSIKKTQLFTTLSIISKIFTCCPRPLVAWILNALQQRVDSLSAPRQSAILPLSNDYQEKSIDDLMAEFEGMAIVSSSGKTKPSKGSKNKKNKGSSCQLSSSTAGKLPEATLLLAPQELAPMDGALIIRVGMHQLYQRMCNYSSSFDADFITFQRAHNNRVLVEQDGLIHDRANHSQIILNTGKGENASMPDWISNAAFNYASRIGMEGKDDYRHMFPFVIDKKFLKYGAYSLREGQPHVEIEAQILYFDEATGTQLVSTLDCVLEYTFDEVTHTCYHRFARAA